MSIKFTCTALAGTNKTGILKPDQYGYYRVILGALNFHNAAGIYYDYDSSKAVFEESSSFMRRITTGNLYGEYEHPKWAPGASFDDFVRRIRYIDGHNISHHIREIELEMAEPGAFGKCVCIIYGWVKPDREKGALLQAAFDNPNQNVCFSIRSLVSDRRIGSTVIRTVDELITFDWVVEPGISKAMKFNAPGLESFSVNDTQEIEVPLPILRSVAEQYRRGNAGIGLGMESDQGAGLEEALKRIDQSRYGIGKPSAILQW